VVNRLANRHRFHPDRLLELYARYRGRRGVTRVPGVVALASPYAESPMETRLRLLERARKRVPWPAGPAPPAGYGAPHVQPARLVVRS
jgi:hypothetical protein